MTHLAAQTLEPEKPKWFAPSNPSPTIHKIRYWAESRYLDISLKSNEKEFYRYENVPEEVYQGISGASHPGTYFNKAIRGKFAETKVPFAAQGVHP